MAFCGIFIDSRSKKAIGKHRLFYVADANRMTSRLTHQYRVQPASRDDLICLEAMITATQTAR
jgi:hypothetical protein